MMWPSVLILSAVHAFSTEIEIQHVARLVESELTTYISYFIYFIQFTSKLLYLRRLA